MTGLPRRAVLGLLAWAGVAGLSGCVTRSGPSGQKETVFGPKYLLKGDIDRVVDETRKAVMAGLVRVADKLYRRNPREWRKAGLTGREEALKKLEDRVRLPPPGLEGKVESQAALLAFKPEFAGDRVAALVYGLLTMVDAAYENKQEFFLLDSLNEQKLYNCARNMEIAIWKLGNSRDAKGELLLLSNDSDPANYNLSFEREFGRIVGILDLMAKIVADKNGRSVTTIVQSLAKAVFLPVGFIK